jgi:hypothetical protein
MPFANALPVPGMEGHHPDAGHLSCFLLILRKNDSEVLLLQGEESDHLPFAEVPRGQRLAPNLLNAVRSQFGIGAVCRFLVSGDPPGPEYCTVLEVAEGNIAPNAEAIWLPIRKILWERIEPLSARDLLWKALAKLTGYAAGHLDGRFVRPGDFGEIAAWVSQSLESRGLRLQGPWMQFTMGPDFSLFRFETNGLHVWFKAVGPPNLREFTITRRMVELGLPHMPTLLAVHEKWHAWLMWDGGGQPLDNEAEETCWKAAARSLGELQIASVPHVGELLKLDCEDLRLLCLRTRIESFLSDLSVLMEAQTTIPPVRLGSGELRRIGYWLEAACIATSNMGLPDTLGHSDISPGNVLAARQGATFLDWVQGHVGHPFLTFEYLLALARRIAATHSIDFDAVRREYLELWRPFHPIRQLEQAFDFVPLIAAFAYALTACGGRSLRNPHSEIAPLIRSLGRRMHVVAERLERARGAPKRF